MAEFIVTIRRFDGGERQHPARTCDECKGLGYLTKPCTFESRKSVGGEWYVHRATSGDPCPMCIGLGWMIVLDGNFHDLSKLKPQL
jgi:hypothetical protein